MVDLRTHPLPCPSNHFTSQVTCSLLTPRIVAQALQSFSWLTPSTTTGVATAGHRGGAVGLAGGLARARKPQDKAALAARPR